jgi:hypothetical protein
MLLFIAEFIAAGLIFNVANSLEVAKEHNFDVKSDVDKAAQSAVNFLYDELSDLYGQEGCTGGAALGEKLPFNFSVVTCKSQPVTDAFHVLLQDPSVATQKELETYKNCTAMVMDGDKPSTFTQAFCGSGANILTLAQKYSRYLVFFPVALAGLTFILLVSTICLIAAAQKERQQQVRLQQGLQPLHRVQMAGP